MADTVDGLVVELEVSEGVADGAPVIELSGGPAICVH